MWREKEYEQTFTRHIFKIKEIFKCEELRAKKIDSLRVLLFHYFNDLIIEMPSNCNSVFDSQKAIWAISIQSTSVGKYFCGKKISSVWIWLKI